jgi:pSer/pThr/pTyr-binding forkhead associated (FHA) protein
MPKLIVRFGNAVITEYDLAGKTSVTVGRKPENDLQIESPVISGQHLRLTREGEIYKIEDLNSTNGTYLNGRQISKAEVNHGDIIEIGRHNILFVVEGKPLPEAPAPRKEAPAEPVKSAAAPEPAKTAQTQKLERKGYLIITGASPETNDYDIALANVYIGKSPNAHIRLKGIFSPDMAAVIKTTPDGYLLVPIESGYPEYNGTKLTQPVLLNAGDEIKCGSAVIKFFWRT